MIKTEVESDDTNSVNSPDEAAQEDFTPTLDSSSRSLAIGSILIVLVLAFASYLVLANKSSKPNLPIARNLGYVTALPLGSNKASSSQSASTLNSLSASGINLQDNLPSGQGSPKTNSLQSAGNTLSTGQSINTSVPF